MRIAIVTSPRTGSSFLSEYLSIALNLKNYKETLNNMLFVFDDGTHTILNNLDLTNEEVIQKLITTDDYVVKFITAIFFDRKLDIEKFPWYIFDKIILLERNDIVTQIVSWYTLNYWGMSVIDRQNVSEYLITDEFINFAVERIKKYYFVKDKLLQNYEHKCIVVEKEQLEKKINDIFDIENSQHLSVVCNSKLDQACRPNNINYESLINSQNLRSRVFNILEKELWKK